MSVLSKVLEWYQSLNKEVTDLTLRDVLLYLGIAVASYQFYNFTIKPFLSPLRKVGPYYTS